MSDLQWFPGEREAVATAVALAEQYGYGNLIMRLKQAWAERLVRTGTPRHAAELSSGLICVWCDTDCRTGRKTKGIDR